ncbi:molybdenum cofactor biosynthesis protein MoaE [Desulfovibrio sp. JY]|nr:molybdenum cofactor biosynthesis protein MoaE [Desulfovibrio sp. JY]
MDISKTIAELKTLPGFLEKVGMVLVHNGMARATSRNGAPVGTLKVKVDQDLVEKFRQEGEAMPGMFRVLVEARAGTFAPGDDLLFIVAAGDIREHVLASLTYTLTHIKAEAITKTEIAP